MVVLDSDFTSIWETWKPKFFRGGKTDRQTSSVLPRTRSPQPQPIRHCVYRTQFLPGQPTASHRCDTSGLAWPEANDFYLRDAESRQCLAKSSAASGTRQGTLGSKKAKAREIFFAIEENLNELQHTAKLRGCGCSKTISQRPICCLLHWPPDSPSLFSASECFLSVLSGDSWWPVHVTMTLCSRKFFSVRLYVLEMSEATPITPT